MDALKKNWFAISNAVFFVLVFGFYFFFVSGTFAERKELSEDIERKLRQVKQKLSQAPTQEWYDAVKEKKELLHEQKEAINRRVVTADRLVEGFFISSDSDERTHDKPESSKGLILKEILSKKWDALFEKYGLPAKPADSTQLDAWKAKTAEKPFLMEKSVFSSVEPAWLRQPGEAPLIKQISEAHKGYFIVEELLKLVEESDVVEVVSMKLSEPILHERGMYKGDLFWYYRQMEMVVMIPYSEVLDLMQSVHESQMLFRVVGIEQKNTPFPPEGIKSNANFVVFQENAPVWLRLTLRHYDYVQGSGVGEDSKKKTEENKTEQEVLPFEENRLQTVGAPSGSPRRGGRR